MSQIQTVLVIDDDEATCALLKQRLRSKTLEVCTTCDPEAGLCRARAGIDLILLDVQMPGMDGFELCRRLRSERAAAEIPVIFLTGVNDVAGKVRAFEVGGQDYVTKPFNELELHARVHNALRMRSLLEQYKAAERENRRLVRVLQARVKELRTLNLVSSLLQNLERDLPELLNDLVRLLPDGWQYSERVAARLTLGDQLFCSEPSWSTRGPAQRACFKTADHQQGLIEVAYLGEVATTDRDVFFPEEQELLDTVAEMLELYLDRRAAAEAQALLTSIIEATTDFVGTINLDGSIRFINRAGRSMLGIADGESVQSMMITDISPEWALRVLFQVGIPAAIRDGVWRGDTALMTRDGREIAISQVIIAHKDADGMPQFLSTIARDMTERNAYEAALLRNEAELTAQKSVLRKVLLHIPFAVYWKDRHGVYEGCNDAYARFLGVQSPEEIVGWRDADLRCSPDEAADWQTLDEEVMTAGEPLLNAEQVIPLASGGTMTLLASRVPLHDAIGEVVGVLGIHADITDQKRAELALRASEAKLNAITAQLPAVVWTTNADLNITSIRGAVLSRLGVDPTVLAGRSMIDVVEESGGNVTLVRRAHSRALHGESVPYEFEIHDMVFDVRVEPLYDDQQQITGCLGIGLDVTARKRAEEIDRERRSLQDAVQAMEQVIGVIGHELRTPLSGLRVISELLMTDHGDDREQHAAFIRSINEEVIRLSEMVDNMLEAARIDSGVANWTWSEFDMAPICHDVAELLRPVTAEGNVVIDVSVKPSHLRMHGDCDAVRRLLLNLISNAQKHTREGSIELRAQREIDEQGTWVRLTVSDSGEGIDRQLADKLGMPFALNSGVISQTTKVQGSGLGLAICKGIAAAHGGRIEIDSVRGRGTTVVVWLRADLSDPAAPDEHCLVFREVAA